MPMGTTSLHYPRRESLGDGLRALHRGVRRSRSASNRPAIGGRGAGGAGRRRGCRGRAAAEGELAGDPAGGERLSPGSRLLRGLQSARARDAVRLCRRAALPGQRGRRDRNGHLLEMRHRAAGNHASGGESGEVDLAADAGNPADPCHGRAGLSASHHQPATEFVRAMGPVALELLGEPNKALSSAKELRFGNRGSLSIDLEKGTWCQHGGGPGESGGVIDLVRYHLRLDKPAAIEWMRERGHLAAADRGAGSKRKIVATYDYKDETGALLFQVCRFEPKDFRQRMPDGAGGWDWKTAGARRVLFRLPEVQEAVQAERTVYLVEGEKAVLALVAAGLDATCSPGGAGKWRQEYSSVLAGADVVILPDADQPGRFHSEAISASLRGVARWVRVLELPGPARKGGRG